MSTSANVASLRPADEGSDRLAALLERRSELEAEIRIVSSPEQTRSAAAASLAKAEAELAELDRSERAAWSNWAENPTVSEQPTPRHEERRALDQRRSLSSADVRAADGAISAVQERVNKLGAEMRQLGPAIYACRLEAIMSEVPSIERQILDSHRRLHEQLARFKALHLALAEEKAAASSRGDQATATLLQETSAHLETLKQPPPAPNWGFTLEHAAAWRAALR